MQIMLTEVLCILLILMVTQFFHVWIRVKIEITQRSIEFAISYIDKIMQTFIYILKNSLKIFILCKKL